jgi:hypothetical protein
MVVIKSHILKTHVPLLIKSILMNTCAASSPRPSTFLFFFFFPAFLYLTAAQPLSTASLSTRRVFHRVSLYSWLRNRISLLTAAQPLSISLFSRFLFLITFIK